MLDTRTYSVRNDLMRAKRGCYKCNGRIRSYSLRSIKLELLTEVDCVRAGSRSSDGRDDVKARTIISYGEEWRESW